MANPNSLPGSPDPDRPTIDVQADNIGNRAARRVGVIRGGIALGVTVLGAAITVSTVPDRLYRLIVPRPDVPQDPNTAKNRLKSSRADAAKVVEEILAREPDINTSTINDTELKVRIDAILSDKKVSRDETWDMLIAWQDTELLAIAKRAKALSGRDAGNPDALEKRLPLMTQAAAQIAPQLKKHVITEGKWLLWVRTLNEKGADPKVVQGACADMRTFMVSYRLHFSADAAAFLAEKGGIGKVTDLGRDRLVAFERGLLEQFVADRHELIGRAHTMKLTLKSVERIGAISNGFSAEMTKYRLTPKGEDEKKIAARIGRIQIASDDLARIITVSELRNKSIDDPAGWKADFDKALVAYFGEGKVPPPSEIAPILRLARLRATHRVGEELNNEHPDCVEAAVVLRLFAEAAVPDGDATEAAAKARMFLEKTKDATDDNVREARDIIGGLLKKGRPTLEEIRAGYNQMGKWQEVVPFEQAFTDRLVDWAGQHKALFRNANLKDKSVQERYAKSRFSCAKSIIQVMDELLRLRGHRVRWQSGLSAAATVVDTGGTADTAMVLDPRTVELELDNREFAKKGISDIQHFLGELGGVHKLKNIDRRRDAAAGTVRVIRKFLHVLDVIRGMEGQVTPQTVTLREIVESYDDAPWRDLLRSYEALEVYLANEASATSAVAKDRAVSNDVDVQVHLKEFLAQPLTAKAIQDMLGGEMTPARRTALRLALEQQRQDALRPFLTEEFAHLLALAGYSDEWSGIVGDMQRSRDSWWSTILFILGLVMTVKGGQGLLRVHGERKNARNIARAVAKELLTKQQQDSDVMRAMIGQVVAELEKKNALKGVPVVHDPQAELGERFDVLSNALVGKDGEEIDLTKISAGKAARCVKKAGKIDGLLQAALACVSLTNMSPTIPAQVQMRCLERTATTMHQKIGKAIDLIDTGSAQASPTRRALGELYGKLGSICSRLRAMEKNLPPTDPTLATIPNIDAASHGELALVAQSLGEPFHVALDELRANLKKHQQPAAVPTAPPVPPPPSNPPLSPPSVS